MNRVATMFALATASLAFAQSEMPAAAPQTRPIALVHARIDPAKAGQAPIDSGFVVFDKGVISGRSAFASSAAACSISGQSTGGTYGSTSGNPAVGAALAHISVVTSIPTGRGRPETSSLSAA